jgi:hypothetical protein
LFNGEKLRVRSSRRGLGKLGHVLKAKPNSLRFHLIYKSLSVLILKRIDFRKTTLVTIWKIE